MPTLIAHTGKLMQKPLSSHLLGTKCATTRNQLEPPQSIAKEMAPTTSIHGYGHWIFSRIKQSALLLENAKAIIFPTTISSNAMPRLKNSMEELIQTTLTL